MAIQKYFDPLTLSWVDANKFSQEINVGDYAFVKTFSGGGYSNGSFETPIGYGMFSSAKGAHLASNAYWDGVSWKKYDSTKYGVYIVPSITNGGLFKSVSPTGNTDFTTFISSYLMETNGGYKVQSGVVTLNITAINTWQSVTLTFPTAFTTAPIVVTQWSSHSTLGLSRGDAVAAEGVNSTGCMIFGNCSNTGARTIHWIAIGN